jgi:signal transduction histidine kinase
LWSAAECKHGAPERVTVELLEDSSTVTLRIGDDGSGFNPGAESGGFGLAGMRERARLLGGTLHVRSAPGEGTTVTATMPALRRDPETSAVEERSSANESAEADAS